MCFFKVHSENIPSPKSDIPQSDDRHEIFLHSFAAFFVSAH